MTPEQEIEQLKNEVSVLREELSDLREESNQLKVGATIPFDVEQAFRSRLTNIINLSVSAKGASTEDITVVDTDGGVPINTYVVLGDPVGFLQITIAGTTYYLPYYS